MSADELLREVERCFIDDSGYFKSEWYGDLKSRIEAHLSAPADAGKPDMVQVRTGSELLRMARDAPTPRTDAVLRDHFNRPTGIQVFYLVEECRLLERELAALREKCDTLLADNYSLRAELEKRK
jgi:hypothetical protein